MLDLFPFNLLFVGLPLENFDVRDLRKAKMSSWGSRNIPHLVSLELTPVVSCRNCKGEASYLKGLQGIYGQGDETVKTIPLDSNYQSWGLSAEVLIYHTSLKVSYRAIHSTSLERLISARYFRGHGDIACDRYANHLSIPCNLLAWRTLILSIQPSRHLGSSVG